MNTAVHLLKNMSGDQEERIQAIFSLLRNNTQEAFEALQYILRNDPSPIVRHEAAYVLGEKGGDFAVQELIRCINVDTNDFVIHESALALGNTRDPRGLEVLKGLLDHECEDIRQTAQIAIERFEPKDILEPAHVILDLDGRAEDRIQASFLLMNEGSLESVDLLIRALHQEVNPIVKHEIIFALGETVADVVISELIEVIEKGGNRFVIHEAALALATIGDLQAEESIASLLDHEDDDIVETAQIALMRLKS